MERLVGYGTQLNIQDSNGDTPLHIAVARESVEVLTTDTPQLRKVSSTAKCVRSVHLCSVCHYICITTYISCCGFNFSV